MNSSLASVRITYDFGARGPTERTSRMTEENQKVTAETILYECNNIYKKQNTNQNPLIYLYKNSVCSLGYMCTLSLCKKRH